MVYLTMVHEVKMLVKMVYSNITKANRKEIIKMVTNTDGQCIWDLDIMEEVKMIKTVMMSRSRKRKGYPHHWTGSTWCKT